MCGRGATINKIIEYQAVLPEDFSFKQGGNQYKLDILDEIPESFINYNMAPQSNVPAIFNNEPKALQMVPWRYDLQVKGKVIPMFNSVIEKAEENYTYYKKDLLERRCIVLFKGYYEWVKQDPNNKKTLKQAVFIHLKNSPVLPLAGFFKKNMDGQLGCSVITTTPIEKVKSIHHRMPFILHPGNMLEYLSPRIDGDKKLILDWLSNNLIDNDSLDYYPISNEVNSSKNKSPHFLNKCKPIFEI